MFCKHVVKSHSSYIYNILFNCSHMDTFKYTLKLAFHYNRDGLCQYLSKDNACSHSYARKHNKARKLTSRVTNNTI